MKKITVFLLIAAFVLSFCACVEPVDNSVAPVESQAETSTDNSEAPIVYSANVPDGFSYGGETVTIVTSAADPATQVRFDFGYNADELEQSVVNDAVYSRIATVEDMLECVIVERCLNRWTNEASSVLPNEILGGVADFQVVSTAVQEASALVYQDIFYNLNDFDGLNNMSDPWWDAAFVDGATIKNKLFFATGDISFRSRDVLGCVLFNKELVQQLGLESPYELVDGKKWTIDTVIEWSQKISNDENSDGKIDYNDSFGIGGQYDNIWAMFYGAGEKTVTRQADGSFEVSLQSERTIAVAEKIMALMQKKEYFVNANDYFGVSGYVVSPSELIVDAFVENRCLLLSTILSNIENVRDMSVDFGILPLPLYDENQENYNTLMNPWAGAAFSLPTSLTEDEAEDAAVLMNVLGAEGKNTVIPAYYEVCLKGQRLRDDESEAMLDLILETAGCDSGHIYDWGRVGYTVLHGAITAAPGTFVSLCQSNEPAIKAAIDRTLEEFDSLG